MLPVVYPNMDNIWATKGPRMSTMVFKISPKIVKRFMPKNERESKTNNTIIMVLLSIPPVWYELKKDDNDVDVDVGVV
jgi:hypothetical protein